MNRYRWTVWTGMAGIGLLALLAVFTTVVRGLNIVVAGVQPEAVVLTAMMTAPFTVGAVALVTVGAALVETFRRRSVDS